MISRANTITALFRAGVLLLTVVLVMACAAGKPYGHYHIDAQVKADFEAYRILPGYDYFFSGPDNHPRAIIGIDKHYELVSTYWKPVDLTEQQLGKWIQSMTHVGVHNARYDGIRLTTPEGTPVGVWYSNYRFTNLYMVGDRQVTVSAPTGYGRKNFSPFQLGDPDD